MLKKASAECSCNMVGGCVEYCKSWTFNFWGNLQSFQRISVSTDSMQETNQSSFLWAVVGSFSDLLSMAAEYSAKFIIIWWYKGSVYALLMNGGVYSQTLIKEALIVA